MEALERRVTLLMTFAIYIHITRDLPMWFSIGVITAAYLWAFISLRRDLRLSRP